MMQTRRILAASVAVAIGGLASQVAGEEFNASVWFPDTHPLTEQGYLEWAPKVEEASGGELEPQVFTGDALLPAAGALSGIRDGIAQVGYHAGTYTPSELPEDNLLQQLAISYSDYFVGAFAITEMNMTDPALLAQWERNGIVFGGGYATPPYRLICTSKVETLDDIKGKRVRMPGAAHSDWAKNVGAVPVNVPSSEMFNGLDKGQLDCAANAANDLKSRSLWDVAKHVTMLDLGVYWAGFEYGYNKAFWTSLTPEQRRVLFDTMAEAIVTTGIAYVASADEAIAEAPDHGVTVYEPADGLAQSVADFAETARATAIREGKEKFGLEDPEGLAERFTKVAQKWEKLLEGVDRTDAAALTKLLKEEVYDKIDAETYGVS